MKITLCLWDLCGFNWKLWRFLNKIQDAWVSSDRRFSGVVERSILPNGIYANPALFFSTKTYTDRWWTSEQA